MRRVELANTKNQHMTSVSACISIPSALAILVIGALTCRGADVAPSSESPPVNYILRVDWRAQKAGTNFLQLITTEGTFKLDGSQGSPVKVGDSEIPITGRIEGTLKALNDQQGKLQLFLGRTVPFVTRSGGIPGGSSIQQRQEGLSSTFIITFGKPLLIQRDENGETSVLVERVTP
jgi:hypothetical protein